MAEDTTRCCPDPSFVAEVDFSTTLGSAETFLRRVGIKEQVIAPHARTEPMAHRVHDIPLKPPLPSPPLQYPLEGEPPPDR